jgi:thioredoxin-like negative regulator of GroEL
MSKPNGTILKANDFQVRGNKVLINLNKTKKVPGMLLIWGDFCGHCHRFMPVFNELTNSLGRNYSCASIESEELQGQKTLTTALNFQGYPTICFFNQKGIIIGQYNGSREKGAILDTICKVYQHCNKSN